MNEPKINISLITNDPPENEKCQKARLESPARHWAMRGLSLTGSFRLISETTLPSHRVTSCEESFLTYYLIQLIYSVLHSILIYKDDIENSWKDFHILSTVTQNATIIFMTGAGHQLFPTLPVFSSEKDFSHTFWLFQNLHTSTHPAQLCCKHVLM